MMGTRDTKSFPAQIRELEFIALILYPAFGERHSLQYHNGFLSSIFPLKRVLLYLNTIIEKCNLKKVKSITLWGQS